MGPLSCRWRSLNRSAGRGSSPAAVIRRPRTDDLGRPIGRIAPCPVTGSTGCTPATRSTSAPAIPDHAADGDPRRVRSDRRHGGGAAGGAGARPSDRPQSRPRRPPARPAAGRSRGRLDLGVRPLSRAAWAGFPLEDVEPWHSPPGRPCKGPRVRLRAGGGAVQARAADLLRGEGDGAGAGRGPRPAGPASARWRPGGRPPAGGARSAASGRGSDAGPARGSDGAPPAAIAACRRSPRAPSRERSRSP